MLGKAPSNYVVEPVSNEMKSWLEISSQRGAFQGWIGDYVVYQRDGQTYGYHRDNKGVVPDYTGSEAGLYPFAGVKPFPVRQRF